MEMLPALPVRKTLSLGVMALIMASVGCSSLRYKKSDDLWAESDAKFKSGQYGDAVPYYDELLRRDENDTRARFHRARSKEMTGANTEALDDYEKVNDARSLLYKAGLDIKAGFYDAAQRDLEGLKGMSLDSHEQVAQYTLIGTLRLRQNNPRMAVQTLERACELARGQSDSFTLSHAKDAHYNAAAAYYSLGEFQSGMEHIESYRQISEQTGSGLDGRDYNMLCLLHYLSGDMEGARTYLSKAEPEWRRKAADDFKDPSFFGS